MQGDYTKDQEEKRTDPLVKQAHYTKDQGERIKDWPVGKTGL